MIKSIASIFFCQPSLNLDKMGKNKIIDPDHRKGMVDLFQID